jgi:tetratricopeptide (TPR) repeat protein
MEYTVECWFERGARFQPDDPMVKALYGVYLVRKARPQEGAAMLQAALRLAGDNANVHYNLGLAFFDLKQYENSLQSAHRAYALGFPLPGLRDKLKRAGKWEEPTEPNAAPQTSPAAGGSPPLPLTNSEAPN